MIISFSCRDVRKIFRIKYLFVFQSKRSRGTAVSKPTFNTPLPTIQRAYFTDTSPRSFLSQSVPRFLASSLPVETSSNMARNYFKFSLLFWTLFLIILLQNSCLGKDKKPDPKNKKEKSSKIGKNILDYNEADLYKLLDQWEVSINMLLNLAERMQTYH